MTYISDIAVVAYTVSKRANYSVLAFNSRSRSKPPPPPLLSRSRSRSRSRDRNKDKEKDRDRDRDRDRDSTEGFGLYLDQQMSAFNLNMWVYPISLDDEKTILPIFMQ